MRRLVLFVLAVSVPGGAAAQSTPNVVFDLRAGSVVSQGSADTRALLRGDVDGDGDADLYAVNHGEANVLFENLGGGVFALGPPGPHEDAGPSLGGAFGDVDGDGDLDLYLANEGDRPDVLLLNQGGVQGGREGHFVKRPGAFGGARATNSSAGAFGDVDGDDRLDLVVAGRGGRNRLFLGQGDGSFVHVVGAFGASADATLDVALADLEGDGDLDVVFANGGARHNALFVNQGFAQGGLQGDFAALVGDVFVSDGGDSTALAVADLDGDDRPEILVANRGDVNFLYRNTSAGASLAFARVLRGPFDPQDPAADDGQALAIAVADVDDDADKDIIVANENEDNSLYLATGESPFDYLRITGGQIVRDGGPSQDAVVADFDGDDQAEVVFANAGAACFFYDNLGPMWTDVGAGLPGHTAPRLLGQGDLLAGEIVSLLVLHAPALAPAVLVTGFDAGFTPFQGGVLVPVPDVVLPNLQTDASGGLHLRTTWPRGLPTGFPLFHQVLVSDAGALFGLALTQGLRSTAL